METQTEALCRAELLQEGGHALIVGIVLVVVLPLAFAGYVTYFVFVYLYGKRARAAAFILAEDPAQVTTLASGWPHASATASAQQPRLLQQLPGASWSPGTGHPACTRPSHACS